MTNEDKTWIQTSIDSGNKYGFPKCCIDDFIAKPPSVMKNKAPSPGDKLRFEMSIVNGKQTGFFPCLIHAKMIQSKIITLGSLIDYKKRQDEKPFPEGWTFI